ncbi:MAG TPA: winged helix-turn-helix domain-containing protein, partial [Steroidobacteraceae bacterium]
MYGAVGGRSPADRERAMLWVLNQSDGAASILDIAERSGISYADTRLAADDLHAAGLLKTADRLESKAAPRALRRRAAVKSPVLGRRPAKQTRKGDRK